MSITFSATTQVPMILDGDPVMVWAPADGSLELEVNMSNGNACHVLSTLGYVGDIWDAEPMTAIEFLGRVLLARGLNPADEGTASGEDVSSGGMVFVECGRPEGYTDERLLQLQELAEFAVEVPDCHITWA